MANIRSQIKRNRQTEVRRRRNRATRSELRTRIQNAVDAAEAGDGTNEATAAMQKLDRAAARRIIHRNTAARRKSRLQKRLNQLA
ncbi:MAG: 30S ribosomal protein S20 [Acidimicrobiales bacterium]|nr:30S ribosomal protein S20 [Acidimicrobiales bacterium]